MGLIECYRGAGNLDIALQLAHQMTKEKGLSGYPELYKALGEIFEAKDEYEKAFSYYSSYFQLAPGAKDRAGIEARIQKRIEEKQKLSKIEEKK